MNTIKALHYSKNIIIGLCFLLTACGSLVLEDPAVDCSPDNALLVSTVQAWNDIEYSLPWCWVATSPSSDQLILRDQDSENQVFIHRHEPDPETLGELVKKKDPYGNLLYVEATVLDDPEIQIILSSIVWPTLEEATIYYSNYKFTLPSSWEMAEIAPTENTREYAELTSRNGSAFVRLYAYPYYDDFGPFKTAKTIPGYFYSYKLSQDGRETILFSETQSALLATNDLENKEVQNIINSIIMNPTEW